MILAAILTSMHGGSAHRNPCTSTQTVDLVRNFKLRLCDDNSEAQSMLVSRSASLGLLKRVEGLILCPLFCRTNGVINWHMRERIS